MTSRYLTAATLLFGIVAIGAAIRLMQPIDRVTQAAAPAGPTLTELCKRHPTDKCAYHHNYVVIYEMLFGPLRSRNLRLLEIGVHEGDSLRLWEAYFSAAQIFGVDIVSKAQHDTKRIKTLVADQGSREALANAINLTGGNYDIILDDGGHTMLQQQVSLGTLFPSLNRGGLYVIEDIHTSFPHLYPNYGVERDGANSSYSLIDRFVRTGKVDSEYLTAAENAYLSEHISHCMYFWRSTELHSDFFACWKK